MTPTLKANLLKGLGLALCILPASLTALRYFPLWISQKETAVSVGAILVLALCAIPFWRVITEAFRSPSAWQLWLVLLLALTFLESIAGGLRAVAAVAFPTSLLGSVCFGIARRIGEGHDE